jgi:outer membrane protein TolC
MTRVINSSINTQKTDLKNKNKMFKLKTTRAFLFFTALFIFSEKSFAQKKYEFSAEQTVDYAMKNAIDVKNALLDIQIQKQNNREITAIALPQVSGNISGTHYFDIPTTTLPDFISPSVYNVLVNNGVRNGSGNPITFPNNGFGSVPAKFGTSWNASGGIDVSQLLFDGQVFVGLKARSAVLTLATQAAEVTKEQIKATVYKLYYQLLVGKQQATSIDANIDRFEKLLRDTREIYKNGFAEKLDVDKVEVQLNNLKTEKEKIFDQLTMGNDALKFLVNIPQKDSLIQTDTLSLDKIESLVLNDSVNYNNRKEYQQLTTAIKLNEYNIKRFQYSKIPTLAAFGTYSKNAQRNEFNFFGNGQWFSTSLVGVKLSVPIFDGNARNARIQKAKYELYKVKNNMTRLQDAIDMEVANARVRIGSALKTLETQKQNTALAEKVYNSTKLKYEQGLGSNIEIYTAQTELKVAQNNYYGAMYDAIVAKIDFLKAIGKLP